MSRLLLLLLKEKQAARFFCSLAGRSLTLSPNVKAAGSKTGLGSPVNPQPGRLRYVAQASPPVGSGSGPLPNWWQGQGVSDHWLCIKGIAL